MKPTLIILAAGIGCRYGGLKVLAPVGPSGELIIEYSVFDAVRAGFGRVIFVINELIEKDFREKIGDKVSAVIPVEYAYQRFSDLPPGYKVVSERSKPWGTGHAVYCSRGLIDGPFAVINADDFYGAGAYKKVAEFLIGVGAGATIAEATTAVAGANAGTPFSCCMAGYRVENTLSEHGFVSRGICSVSDKDELIEVTERTRIERRGGDIVYIEADREPAVIAPGTVVSMSIWGFPGHVMAEFERQLKQFLDSKNVDLSKAEFFLPVAVNEMLINKIASVKVLKTEDKWYGVTYLQDKEQVQQAIAALVAAGKYPEKLWPD